MPQRVPTLLGLIGLLLSASCESPPVTSTAHEPFAQIAPPSVQTASSTSLPTEQPPSTGPAAVVTDRERVPAAVTAEAPVDGEALSERRQQAAYWKTHLAIVYHALDPGFIVISTGDFEGEARQFAAVGNAPDPAEVSVETGLNAYELTDFIVYPAGDRRAWDGGPVTGELEVRSGGRSYGTVLLQMIEDRRLEGEFFPELRPAEVAGFGPGAVVYER